MLAVGEHSPHVCEWADGEHADGLAHQLAGTPVKSEHRLLGLPVYTVSPTTAMPFGMVRPPALTIRTEASSRISTIEPSSACDTKRRPWLSNTRLSRPGFN